MFSSHRSSADLGGAHPRLYFISHSLSLLMSPLSDIFKHQRKGKEVVFFLLRSPRSREDSVQFAEGVSVSLWLQV